MINIDIPYGFIASHTHLSWSEVKFGLDEQYIDPSVAIEVAVNRLCQTDDASADEIHLAGLSEDDSVSDVVCSLASSEAAKDVDNRRKWLYLILARAYDLRESINDPLALVEEIYSDFDYPEKITGFVRYMPMDGPDLGSKDKNEARLFENWRAYLEKESSLFA